MNGCSGFESLRPGCFYFDAVLLPAYIKERGSYRGSIVGWAGIGSLLLGNCFVADLSPE